MKELWNEIMSWGWVKALGVFLGAVVLAILGVRAASNRRRAKQAGELAQRSAMEHTKEGLRRAEEYKQVAEKHKSKAKRLEDQMEAKLDKLGKENESIDDVADRFNSRRRERLRNSSNDA